jgi:DNA replication protein DnaC
MDRISIPKTDDDLMARIAAFKARGEAIGDGPPLPPANPPDGRKGCPACDGTGFYLPDGGDRYLHCPCKVVEVYADGVPYEFQSARLENYREEDGNRSALTKARAFLAGTRDLYLSGTVGAGKTRLACSILNDYVRQRRTGYFARVPWMLHELQPGRDSSELEQRLVSTSLLVMDDIAAERDQATDYTRRTLLMIYEQRHDRGLRTIWTSNKTLRQLAEMQDDERLASRIAGRADVILLTTPDQRMLRRVK